MTERDDREAVLDDAIKRAEAHGHKMFRSRGGSVDAWCQSCDAALVLEADPQGKFRILSEPTGPCPEARPAG